MFRWLSHPWLTVRTQIALGLLFLVAAWPKLMDPPSFAKMVHYYQLFPAWSIFPIAIVVPWLESLCGLALVLGVWVRGATLWIAAMLCGFILALSINLARGHAVDCGCYSVTATPKTREEKLADMKWTILRDLGMLLLAGQIWMAQKSNVSED